jgi:hypothetical protein
VCLDEMGPEGVKSFPGKQVVQLKTEERAIARAKQEIDYGRRGKGYVFGALMPSSGTAFTKAYAGRTSANWVDFLAEVDKWLEVSAEKVYAILDNLSTHRTADVLLFSVQHPRCEFVFQPKYAAYLNLIKPWWKILGSIALKAKRCESWEEIEQAIVAATVYWNKHRHPFVWGRNRHQRSKRSSGIAALPNVR